MPLNFGTLSLDVPWNQIYRIGEIEVGNNVVEMLNRKDFNAAMRSPLTAPSLERPIARLNGFGVRISIAGEPNPLDATPANATLGLHPNMSINYIMRPPEVQWAYVIVNDKPLYNDNVSVDFELHASEETELVYKILKLAGVNLKAGDLTQVGEALEQAQIQQQKQ